MKKKKTEYLHVKWQWLMNMCAEFEVYIFKNDRVTSQKQPPFKLFTMILNFYFSTDFQVSKSVVGPFSRSLRKYGLKHVGETGASSAIFITLIWVDTLSIVGD